MSLHISNSPSSESEWSDIGIPRNEQYNAQHIVSDAAYAAKLPSSSTESPLSEQQEPIAVVGMGMNSVYHVLIDPLMTVRQVVVFREMSEAHQISGD